MFTFVNDTSSYDICRHQDNLLHFGLTTKLTFLKSTSQQQWRCGLVIFGPSILTYAPHLSGLKILFPVKQMNTYYIPSFVAN